MAQKYILLSVLWIAVAIAAPAAPEDATTPKPTTTTAAPETTGTTPKPTTTTAAPGTTGTTPKPTTTTAAPGTAGTTPKPTTTTAAPGTAGTTPKPTTTTAAPGTAGTTPKPTTTTAAPGTAGTTPKPTTTTAAPGTAGTTPKPTTTTAAPTTPLPAPCDSSPCGDGATCNNFGPTSFTCSCLAGDTYDDASQTCRKAKVFPGELNVPGLTYEPSMSDKTSEGFREAAQKITNELERLFGDSDTQGYIGSRVVEITQGPTRNSAVVASVENSFQPNSEVTSNSVTSVIKDASSCPDCLLADSVFTERSLCDVSACDDETTSCISSDGSFTCKCRDGYISTNFSDRICIGACPSGFQMTDSVCEECSFGFSGFNCEERACPSGYRETDSGCDKCSFGYSGFNCEENWQLLLVIIGSVLGGLLLICLILLPVVALKCSKKGSKNRSDADIGEAYITHSSAKSPLVNRNVANSQASLNGSDNGGVPRIPRATTNSTWDSRTNLEMSPSHSRQNLISEGKNPRPFDDQDEITPYGVSRQNSQHAQRPQNRAQFNPYAQGKGHSNPYYQRDGGR